MNILVTLNGSNQIVEMTQSCRVVWVEPVSGTGSVTVSYATPRADGQTDYVWHAGPTIDLTAGAPERVLPDFFPCAAIRVNGPAAATCKIVSGEPMNLSARSPFGPQ